ncbi:ferritin-like domain-containing protein [Methyloversatilis universalis]|uniref:ferritin-like domain-containing protein n=1 Tax=Methyloversatilis universalis TaxID=378211 RepID=UPI00036472A5|nr:PA2169 family four-helix-bundle protein [Methyloversatilis universalis]
MSATHYTDTLNALIETCRDGEYGFNECATRARASQLKALFRARADAYRCAADTLQNVVSSGGVEPDTGGSVGGALHRSWVGLRSALTGDDNVAMLNEAERTEDRALLRYRDALSRSLPADVRLVVEHQLLAVRHSHDRICLLRDQYRAVA